MASEGKARPTKPRNAVDAEASGLGLTIPARFRFEHLPMPELASVRLGLWSQAPGDQGEHDHARSQATFDRIEASKEAWPASRSQILR